MNVCATDAGISNPNQNVVDADGRLSNLFQPEASFRTALYQGFHSILQLAATHVPKSFVFAHTVYRKYVMMRGDERFRPQQLGYFWGQLLFQKKSRLFAKCLRSPNGVVEIKVSEGPASVAASTYKENQTSLFH
jgi:hypothetical protein